MDDDVDLDENARANPQILHARALSIRLCLLIMGCGFVVRLPCHEMGRSEATQVCQQAHKDKAETEPKTVLVISHIDQPQSHKNDVAAQQYVDYYDYEKKEEAYILLFFGEVGFRSGEGA